MGNIYCELLQNKYIICILFIGTIFYLYFAIVGTFQIDAKLDTDKILPQNCPIREPNRIITNMVWTQYYPVTIMVNNPLDIRSKKKLDKFNQMVDEFESMKLCKGIMFFVVLKNINKILGKEFTTLWLRDYIKYLKNVEDYGFNYYDDSLESNKSVEATKFETGLDYSQLNKFLSIHKHYFPFLKIINIRFFLH